jgi:hypothetical protein
MEMCGGHRVRELEAGVRDFIMDAPGKRPLRDLLGP